MAATAKKSATRSRTKQAGPTVEIDRVLDAALAEAAAVGWRATTLSAIAARAKLPLGAVLVMAPTKAYLLARFIDRLDRLTLAPVVAPDTAEPPRDRLFEVLMRRFDALNRNRDGARALIAGVARDPAAIAMSLARIDRSLSAVLTAAGVSSEGLVGFARIKGLKAVYLAALRAWMRDDTGDMSKTMAVLDRALGYAERAARLLSSGLGRRGAARSKPAEHR